MRKHSASRLSGVHMNRYDFLIYESRQGEASIEAESP